jgi:NitT/TauT family transport system substrate-binding protein
MTGMTRRSFVGTLAAAPLALLPPRRGAAQTPLRMLLNSGYSSVNAWVCLAEDRGYLNDAGVRLTFTAGRGAYTAAGRTADEGFDIGYGDVNALVERVASAPDRAPIAVYTLFNRSPSVVAVPAESPVRSVADLAGRHVRGHATDVALQTFPALAARTGVDARRVRISTSEVGMRQLVDGMVAGESDAIFGYESTIAAALVGAGRPVTRVRFLHYRTLVPELYGSALMVARRLVREQPALVTGLVRAVNRGVADVIADPDAAIAAVRRRDPALVVAAERDRLARTLAGEMGHADGPRLGLGAIDGARFAAGMTLLCAAKSLRVPAVSDVVSDAFPVPAGERITRLSIG